MNIMYEKSLSSFEFWGGAKTLAAALTEKELRTVEGILEEEYPDGMAAEYLNDVFAYDGDTIAEWLGLKDEEYILCRRDADYLLSEARELLEKIREDNFLPEFTLSETEVFRQNTGMSGMAFIEGGWMSYVASKEEIPFCELADAVDDEYDDTLAYIRLEMWDEEISGVISSLKSKTGCGAVVLPGGESMASFRDRLTSEIESLKNLLTTEDQEEANTLIENINLCDDLCTGEKTEEDEMESDDEMER